jgi:hypothetical protein
MAPAKAEDGRDRFAPPADMRPDKSQAGAAAQGISVSSPDLRVSVPQLSNVRQSVPDGLPSVTEAAPRVTKLSEDSAETVQRLNLKGMSIEMRERYVASLRSWKIPQSQLEVLKTRKIKAGVSAAESSKRVMDLTVALGKVEPALHQSVARARQALDGVRLESVSGGSDAATVPGRSSREKSDAGAHQKQQELSERDGNVSQPLSQAAPKVRLESLPVESQDNKDDHAPSLSSRIERKIATVTTSAGWLKDRLTQLKINKTALKNELASKDEDVTQLQSHAYQLEERLDALTSDNNIAGMVAQSLAMEHRLSDVEDSLGTDIEPMVPEGKKSLVHHHMEIALLQHAYHMEHRLKILKAKSDEKAEAPVHPHAERATHVQKVRDAEAAAAEKRMVIQQKLGPGAPSRAWETAYKAHPPNSAFAEYIAKHAGDTEEQKITALLDHACILQHRLDSAEEENKHLREKIAKNNEKSSLITAHASALEERLARMETAENMLGVLSNSLSLEYRVSNAEKADSEDAVEPAIADLDSSLLQKLLNSAMEKHADELFKRVNGLQTLKSDGSQTVSADSVSSWDLVTKQTQQPENQPQVESDQFAASDAYSTPEKISRKEIEDALSAGRAKMLEEM